jgi:hypothetical protein
MNETTIVRENVGIAGATVAPAWPGALTGLSLSGVSWSAIIAGAFTAIAVSIIIVSLGTGIGMVLVSPYSYSSPSASTMTVIGALWLVFAQAVGYATGGYVAGRLRRPPAPMHDNEVKFRDGAHGLVVWAIGVVVSSLVIASAVEKIGTAAGTAAAGATIVGAGAASQSPSMAYFTDALLRRNPQSAANGGAANGAAPNGASPNGGAATGDTAGTPNAATSNGAAPNAGNAAGQRGQINRILITSMGANGMSNDDRTYLAQLVSAQTGLSQEDAQRRVDDVVNRAKQDATQAADAARKAAAYVSFWTFMSLLFGAVCATLGGVLGGDLRDEFAARGVVATSPR